MAACTRTRPRDAGTSGQEVITQMGPADVLRALSRHAWIGTLAIAVSMLPAVLPVSPIGPVGHLPVEGRSGLSVTARVAAASGGRFSPSLQGCTAQVVLLVTLANGRYRAWSGDTVLIYDAPRGALVLTGRTASTSHMNPNRAPVRFPLARLRHGLTFLTLTLSLRAGPIQVRHRYEGPHREIGAHVGGTLRIMQGSHTLTSTVLNLFAPVRCAISQPALKPRLHQPR
jgi:hypothetical protein